MRVFTDFEAGTEADNGAAAESSERIRANVAGVGTILAVASARGGVGKSMIAVNMAIALALKGRKVAILDADLNSPSVPFMLGMKAPRHFPMIEGIEPAAGPHGLRVISSDVFPGGEPAPMTFLGDDGELSPPAQPTLVQMSYREALQRILAQTQFGTVDLMIIDTASGLDRLHTIASMIHLDGILLLSHASGLDALAARRTLNVAKCSAPVLGIVENMVGFNCDGCRSVRPLFPEGDLHGVARESEVPILARLGFDPRLADSGDRGTAFVREYAATPTGKVLNDLAARIETILLASNRADEPVA
jgi:ATP-binding protein involved in chromosome partitioning